MTGIKGRRPGADAYAPSADAVGSLYYKASSGLLVPLAPGTSGDVVTSNGSGAAPSYQTPTGGGGGGSSDIVLLGTYTGSAVSSIDALTRTASGTSGDLFQTDYHRYLAIFHSVVLSATGNVPAWRVSTNGSTFISTGSGTYGFTGAFAFGSTTGSQASTTATSILFRDPSGVPAQVANTGWLGEHLIVNPTNTSFHTEMNGHHSVNEATQGQIAFHWTGRYAATTAVKGIQLIPSNSGNISGEFSIYGLKH